MGLKDLFSKESLETAKLADPRQVFKSVLQKASGADYTRTAKYSIFYRIIGFKGLSTGVGCSTVVANTALALADLGLTVAVIDTSMLHPIQYKYLNAKPPAEKERLDWSNMPFTDESVLRVSSRNRKISVLGFDRTQRTVLDMFSTIDSPELIDLAIEKLVDKFDIILIDLCDELTKVNVTSMQKAQHVIQVWDDSVHNMENLDGLITDSVLLSCPLDKMRYVVENKIHEDIKGDLKEVYKQYRFRPLARCGISEDISRVALLGSTIWQYASLSEDIAEFTEMIIDIVKHICDIKDEEDTQKELALEKEEEEEDRKASKSKKGRIRARDITEGKVEGTVHREMMQMNRDSMQTISIEAGKEKESPKIERLKRAPIQGQSEVPRPQLEIQKPQGTPQRRQAPQSSYGSNAQRPQMPISNIKVTHKD